jgi:hypothetical protein
MNLKSRSHRRNLSNNNLYVNAGSRIWIPNLRNMDFGTD